VVTHLRFKQMQLLRLHGHQEMLVRVCVIIHLCVCVCVCACVHACGCNCVYVPLCLKTFTQMQQTLQGKSKRQTPPRSAIYCKTSDHHNVVHDANLLRAELREFFGFVRKLKQSHEMNFAILIASCCGGDIHKLVGWLWW